MILSVVSNFYLTWKCNLHCSHCEYDCHIDDNLEMTDRQLRIAMSILRKIQAHKFSIGVVGITGGEPTSHTNFWNIVDNLIDINRHAQRHFPLELHTNGIQPISEIYIKTHYKIFNKIFVGCDTFHNISNVNFEELSQLGPIAINRMGINENTAQVRLMGRAKTNYANNTLHVGNYCMFARHYDCQPAIMLNFTPDGIKFCTEVGRDEYNSLNFIDYPNGDGDIIPDDYFKTLINKALEYAIYYNGENCATPCKYAVIEIKKEEKK